MSYLPYLVFLFPFLMIIVFKYPRHKTNSSENIAKNMAKFLLGQEKPDIGLIDQTIEYLGASPDEECKELIKRLSAKREQLE